MSLAPVGASGRGLPKSRQLRARLKPHLDADPELLAALLIHLELVRDDLVLLGRQPVEKDDGGPPFPPDGDAA